MCGLSIPPFKQNWCFNQLKKMKSSCFGDVRATKLPLGTSSLIMPTCFSSQMLNAISRHTHSMTWNSNRHRLRQELKRGLRRWQSRTVSGCCLSADACRDCTISTPTMNDTRIKWNTFTLKKKVKVTQFPSETERHCEAKHKIKSNLHLTFHRLRLSQRTGLGHNAQTCALGDGPPPKWRTTRREQREESVW